MGTAAEADLVLEREALGGFEVVRLDLEPVDICKTSELQSTNTRMAVKMCLVISIYMYRCVVPPIRQAFPAGARDMLLIMYDVVDAMLAGGVRRQFCHS